jgi:hypothetical protein
MSIIGFHFVDYVYDGAKRARWLQHIIAIHPRFVVVLVGAQREQATLFCAEIMRHSPQTAVIIRHYADGGDDGRWREFNDDGQRNDNYIEAEDYIARIGGLYKAALADYDNWYLMPDNEFSSDDRPTVDAWIAWQLTAAKAAHEAGIKLALGCQPTHNPSPKDIDAGWYDPLYIMFRIYPEHVYYRNVYYEKSNLDGLRYVRNITDHMKKVAGYVPTIVIGELARLRSIHDAQHGYKSIEGWTRELLAHDAVTQYRTYLQGLSAKGVYACWYSVGDWPIGKDTFNIADDDAFFRVLKDTANEKLPDTGPLPQPEPPVIVPEPPPDPEDTVEIEKPVPNSTRAILERHVQSIRLLVETHHARRKMLQAEMEALDANAQLLQVELLIAEQDLEQLTEAASAA